MDERARDLYRGAPEDFTRARDALAKELRDANRVDDAAAVKSLRKPTVVAWALDQLADRDPEGVGALLDAGAEVRAAQRAAISPGGSAERLRSATAARRQAVSRLVKEATDALRESGRSPDPHVDDLAATLEAASVDAEAGERLRLGTLDAAIREPAGFGDVTGLRVIPGTGGATDDADAGRTVAAESARLRRDAENAAREARKARATADRLAQELAGMQARVEELATRQSAAEEAAREAERIAAGAAALATPGEGS
jgi:hypothetical protein